MRARCFRVVTILLLGTTSVIADPIPTLLSRVILYSTGSATSAHDMRDFVIEIKNQSSRPIRVMNERKPTTYFVKDFTPLPLAGGEVDEAWYELAVDVLKPVPPAIHIVESSRGFQQTHLETLAPSETTLIKVSLLPGDGPPGSHCRIKCRLRTKDGYICESDWVTFDYLPE